MKHYYFKFLKGNKGIEIWKKQNSDEIDLSIYYGNWKVEEYEKKIKEKLHFLSRNQIIDFFSLKESKEDIYFWIYYKDKIYCFKALNLDVYNGSDIYNLYYKDNKIDSYPKSIKAKRILTLNKIDEPEFFSNINSNQKYNRLTLKELENKELNYATAKILKKSILINFENFQEYLSPMQFETLLFLIFSTKNNFCSSFRGGTLKDYDLRIILEENFHEIPKGKHWLQLKFKTNEQLNIDGYLVSLDKTNISKNIIGIDWIKKRIKEREDIVKWLNKAVFDYKLLNNRLI